MFMPKIKGGNKPGFGITSLDAREETTKKSPTTTNPPHPSSTDQNLSRKLVTRLADIFPDASQRQFKN